MSLGVRKYSRAFYCGHDGQMSRTGENITLHFSALCTISVTRFRIVDDVRADMTFRVVSNTTRASKEFAASTPYVATDTNKGLIDSAWTAIDAATMTTLLDFVMTEAAMPSSGLAFDPLAV